MKLKDFRIIILVIALFVVGACSSNDNNNNNNDENNNNNNNEEVQNNEDENENSENNNENDENDENDSNDNNNNEENASGNENNDNDPTDNDGDVSSVDFQDITFGYTGEHDLREMLELDDDMPMVGYIIDPMTGTSFNIIAEQLPMELTLDEYVELAKENQGIEFENESSTTINGIDMHEFQGYQDDVPVMMRIFLHNNVAYVLSYGSADEETLEEYKSVFDEVSESIELN